MRLPQRDQIEMRWLALEQLLEPEHPARVVWGAVCGLDLGRWLGEIRAVEGSAGRDATDPRLLVALWVYATLDGVGSAREVARLCGEHLAYQWLCGGVTVNYHLLSDFRSQGGDKWDALLTQIVASLMAEDLVTLRRVAQDGMRVRADAGSSSFRSKSRLQQCLEEARQQVEALKGQEGESPEASTHRQQAARARAAAERQQKLKDALRQCEELQQQREETAKKSGRPPREPRASTTDADARNMKFPDGGTRPGMNVQFMTDTDSGVIAGVDVTNVGSDQGELPPMLDQMKRRYDRVPDEALVDGGFASLKSIDEAAQRGCTPYAPLKDEHQQLAAGKDPYAPKPGDGAAVAAWRARMGTAAAKAIYRLRCQTAEWINAICRNHGLWQMPVRGKVRCRIVATLHAITHNLMRGVTLRAEKAMEGT
ncbi:MAG: IS1182 family transposase [Chthoniobacteraceae bacterium]